MLTEMYMFDRRSQSVTAVWVRDWRETGRTRTVASEQTRFRKVKLHRGEEWVDEELLFTTAKQCEAAHKPQPEMVFKNCTVFENAHDAPNVKLERVLDPNSYYDCGDDVKCSGRKLSELGREYVLHGCWRSEPPAPKSEAAPKAGPPVPGPADLKATCCVCGKKLSAYWINRGEPEADQKCYVCSQIKCRICGSFITESEAFHHDRRCYPCWDSAQQPKPTKDPPFATAFGGVGKRFLSNMMVKHSIIDRQYADILAERVMDEIFTVIEAENKRATLSKRT